METDEPTRELRVKSTVNGNHLLLLLHNNSVWIITGPGLARFQIALSLPNNCFRCGVVSFIVINALWFFCHIHCSRPLSLFLFGRTQWQVNVLFSSYGKNYKEYQVNETEVLFKFLIEFGDVRVRFKISKSKLELGVFGLKYEIISCLFALSFH